MIERDRLKRKLRDDLHCNFMPSDDEDSENEGNNIDMYYFFYKEHL
jgi:hypothetical protein